MPNLQLNRLKSEMKNGTEVTLKVSLNVVGHSNDENKFLFKQLLLVRKFQSFIKLLQLVYQPI